MEKADKSFILDLNHEKLAAKIINYFELSDANKAQLSRKFRKAAEPYKTSIIMKDFKAKWQLLIKQLKLVN